MKEAKEFFQGFEDRQLNKINTCMIGEIQSFDPVAMKADIKLLPDNDIIVEVPVMTIQSGGFFIRVPYQKGDPVAVLFAQRDIDDIIRGGRATESQRRFSLDDAVCIGGINFYTNSLPAGNSDKLVIGEKGGGFTMAIGGGKATFSGAVDFAGPVTVQGTALTPGGSEF